MLVYIVDTQDADTVFMMLWNEHDNHIWHSFAEDRRMGRALYSSYLHMVFPEQLSGM